MIAEQIGSYATFSLRVDAEDRISRKRIERMKEGWRQGWRR